MALEPTGGNNFSASQEAARERARSARGAELEMLLHESSPQVLDALLENPALGEPHLLILLSRRDLGPELVARIAKTQEWTRSYAVKLALLRHPKTPRQLALPLLKFIYLFDLMALATNPAVRAEMRRLAEDMIIVQREAISLGQRITLARRGSERVVAALLLDSEPQVIEAALANPFATERAVAAALVSEKAAPYLTHAVDRHPRWRSQHQVKVALVRSRHLSLGRFAAIVPELTSTELRDLAEDRRAPSTFREYAAKLVQHNKRAGAKKPADV